MACNTNSMLFLGTIFVVLMATSTQLAHGTRLNRNITQSQVAGRLFCSSNGNLRILRPITGVPNATVTLQCRLRGGSGTVNLNQTLTNSTGNFNVVIFGPSSSFLLNRTYRCNIIVQLPVSNCTLLPTTGNLTASLNFDGFVSSATGLMARFKTFLFRPVRA